MTTQRYEHPEPRPVTVDLADLELIRIDTIRAHLDAIRIELAEPEREGRAGTKLATLADYFRIKREARLATLIDRALETDRTPTP